MMQKRSFLLFLLSGTLIFVACKPTRKIQTAIAKKDTVETVTVVANDPKADSMRYISDTYHALMNKNIDYRTFSAKIDVDYVDADDKKYNFNAFLRMQKDSIIWIKIDAIFGIEALRAVITRDSVRILDKQNKAYTVRAVEYLQDVAAMPLDLAALQQLIIGNPVFLDSNIVSYSKTDNYVSLLSIGEYFKNLITLNADDMTLQRSKLDDIDPSRNRTCDLSYSDYENKKGVHFATKRKIVIAEKTKLDIKLDFKQYEFNEMLSYPFSIPKNYKRK
jgi:Domain of unknown function (DUF4292)